MTIEIWLGIALTISVSVNIILYWFSREQARRLKIVSENIGDLLEIITNYGSHLKKMYSLDAFYGDETLQFLIEHTGALIEMLGEQYSDIITLTEQIEYETEETTEVEKDSTEQDVFYGGSRERNS
tara:strand:+ start:3276 stop:3653 length:378 start_codon:yes stop_codon:yes gene_type:complete